MRLLIRLFFLMSAVMFCVGCATVTNVKKGELGVVEFTSAPSGATVLLSRQNVGKTPLRYNCQSLVEWGPCLVQIKLDGYEIYETQLTQKANPAFFGNALWGLGGYPGLVVSAAGLTVDQVTGAWCELSTSHVHAELEGAVNRPRGFRPSNPDHALICIYRPNMHFGRLFSPDVYLDDRKLIKLRNNRYITVEVDAGEYDVRLERTRLFGVKPEGISLTAESGEAYFFCFAAHKHTIMNLDPTARLLHLVPWEQGEDEVKDCKYAPLIEGSTQSE